MTDTAVIEREVVGSAISGGADFHEIGALLTAERLIDYAFEEHEKFDYLPETEGMIWAQLDTANRWVEIWWSNKDDKEAESRKPRILIQYEPSVDFGSFVFNVVYEYGYASDVDTSKVVIPNYHKDYGELTEVDTLEIISPEWYQEFIVKLDQIIQNYIFKGQNG